MRKKKEKGATSYNQTLTAFQLFTDHSYDIIDRAKSLQWREFLCAGA